MTMTTPLVSKEKEKVSYLRAVQNELKKVTWTPRKELIVSTKAVIIATFCFAFAIYLADLAIRGTLEGVGSLLRLIIG
jgi:preprotein translocase SecE subunit